MKNSALSRVAFFAILLISTESCSGQPTEILPITKKYIDQDTDYELFKRVPTVGLNRYVPSDSLRNLIMPDSSAYVMEVDLSFILPNDNYLTPFHIKYGHNYLFYLRPIGQERVEVIVDCNYNHDFNDEKRDTLFANNGGVVQLDLSLDNSSNLTFPVLLVLNVKATSRKITGLVLKTLLKYELNYSIGSDTLHLDLLTNYWYINFRYDVSNIKQKTYRLDEPFRFANKWWKLQRLDLLKATVELVELDPDNLYGYQEGFYVDLATIRELTDANMMDKYRIDWNEKEYFLLHFWGDWCQPCVAEIPQTKDLASALEKNSGVEFIHYPVIYQDTMVDKLKKFILNNNLSLAHQSVIMENQEFKCPIDLRVQEKCSVVSLLRNSTYPEYILLDASGRILYRGENNSALYDRLKQYKLLE